MEREFVSVPPPPPSLSADCIFMHSDGPRRNAGRPAPRRFSRPVYISSSARTRHRTSHAHDQEWETHSSGGHSWPPALRIRSRERRRYFSPWANRKNKECRTNAGDRAGRHIIGAATKFLFSLIESIRRRHGARSAPRSRTSICKVSFFFVIK